MGMGPKMDFFLCLGRAQTLAFAMGVVDCFWWNGLNSACVAIPGNRLQILCASYRDCNGFIDATICP
jgi:hypothetical protein